MKYKTYKKNWKKVHSLIAELALLNFLQQSASEQLKCFFLVHKIQPILTE